MLKAVLTFLALGVSSAAMSQSAYVEGTDYFRLRAVQPTQVAKGKVEVVEIFRYGCIHCAHMEGPLNAWKKRMPANAQLRQIHATFGDEGQKNLSRAHLAAIALGISDKVHPAMFKEVEAGRQPPTDLNEIGKKLAPLGIKVDTFVATANSFSVTQKINQNEAIQPRYEIGGTPEFIVAGKYRVSVQAGKTQEYALQVVDYLIQKESIESAASTAKK
jgi:protein dithiol oxidoreductase (disulfide-forming)